MTLIPFIQEHEMLSAIAEHCPPERLSADERVRNSFGRAFSFSYDPARTDTVVSTLPGVFPDVHLCPVREDVWVERPLPVLLGPGGVADVDLVVCEDSLARCDAHYSARPRPGCVVPAPGFPTLHSLAFSPVLTNISLNIFGFASKKDSLIVAVGSGRRREHMYGLSDSACGSDDDDDPFLANAGAAAAFVAFESERGGADAHGFHARAPDGRRASDAAALPRPRDALVPPHRAEFRPASLYCAGTTVHGGPTYALSEAGPRAVVEAFSAARRPSAQAFAPLLGQVVFVEWPHLREALVVGVDEPEGVDARLAVDDCVGEMDRVEP